MGVTELAHLSILLFSTPLLSTPLKERFGLLHFLSILLLSTSLKEQVGAIVPTGNS
jgi:hypothetical protein